MTVSQKTYYDHVGEASKPISERKEVILGRNGTKRSVRRHHLSMQVQVEMLRKQVETGKFVSPYKQFTSYWGVTQALADLGENEWHSPADLFKAVERRMSHDDSKNEGDKTSWERFKGRPSRSRERGLDYIGKLLQNLNVLQRLGGMDPYGLKLAQLGACIDLKPTEKGLPMARLRTGIPKGEPVQPLNEIRRRKGRRGVESVPSQISFVGEPVGTKSAAATDDIGSAEALVVSGADS